MSFFCHTECPNISIIAFIQGLYVQRFRSSNLVCTIQNSSLFGLNYWVIILDIVHIYSGTSNCERLELRIFQVTSRGLTKFLSRIINFAVSIWLPRWFFPATTVSFDLRMFRVTSYLLVRIESVTLSYYKNYVKYL